MQPKVRFGYKAVIFWLRSFHKAPRLISWIQLMESEPHASSWCKDTVKNGRRRINTGKRSLDIEYKRVLSLFYGYIFQRLRWILWKHCRYMHTYKYIYIYVPHDARLVYEDIINNLINTSKARTINNIFEYSFVRSFWICFLWPAFSFYDRLNVWQESLKCLLEIAFIYLEYHNSNGRHWGLGIVRTSISVPLGHRLVYV